MRIIALILGMPGGAFLISLAFLPPVYAPVTEVSEMFFNQLQTPAPAELLFAISGPHRRRRYLYRYILVRN